MKKIECPCKNCLTLSICRSKIRSDRVLKPCILLCKYMDPPDGDFVHRKERYMYRQTRINKVRRALGLKKARKSGITSI